MAISYQKRGNKKYAYDIKYRWNSEKQKSELVKKTYLGVVSKTGEIIPKKEATKSIKSIKNYGCYYAIKEIMLKLNLFKAIESIFNKEDTELIFNLIYFRLTSNEALYLQPFWVEDNFSDLSISSSMSSRFIENLGKKSSLREGFFKSWNDLNKNNKNSLVLDLTSISTHSDNIEYAEFGHNKDGDILKQVNLGVVYNQTTNNPVAYRAYPGTIKDVTTITNIIKLINSLKIKEACFTLDRGFCSKSNIKHITAKNIDFIVSMPFTSLLAKDLIRNSSKELSDINSIIIYKTETLNCVKKEIKLDGENYYSYIYRNSIQESYSVSNFILKLDEIIIHIFIEIRFKSLTLLVILF